MTTGREEVAPEVSTSTAGTVVMELAPKDAELLGRILFQYDAVMKGLAEHPMGIDPVDGYDPQAWAHTGIDLLAQAASLGVVAEMIPVACYIPPGAGS